LVVTLISVVCGAWVVVESGIDDSEEVIVNSLISSGLIIGIQIISSLEISVGLLFKLSDESLSEISVGFSEGLFKICEATVLEIVIP